MNKAKRMNMKFKPFPWEMEFRFHVIDTYCEVAHETLIYKLDYFGMYEIKFIYFPN